MIEQITEIENAVGTAKVVLFRSDEKAVNSEMTKADLQRKITLGCTQILLNDSVKIGHLPSGAPVLSGIEMEISISHSNDLYAIYLSKLDEVGVDVQVIREKIYNGRSYFVNDSEESQFEMNSKNLHLIWSAKEAIYKLRKGEIDQYKESITVKEIGDDHLLVTIENEEVKCGYTYSEEYVLVFTL